MFLILKKLVVNFIHIFFLIFLNISANGQLSNGVENYITPTSIFKKNTDIVESKHHIKKHVFTANVQLKTEYQNKSYKALCLTQPVYREINGSCNNISTENTDVWGSTHIKLNRLIPDVYNINNDLVGENRAHPRVISNTIFKTENNIPSNRLSSFVFTWGQFLDHDMILVPVDTQVQNITVIPNDIIISPIPFNRAEALAGTGKNGIAREQININTAWIDASNVYGSDTETANLLRTFKEGKLKTSKASNGENILPLINDNFVAGDERALEQPGLTSLHILFIREHNRICEALVSCGMTNDESIYQRARKKVVALLQSITYNEFLPALGIQLSEYEGYDNTIQPDILNVFAAAAFRLGHTMVTDELVFYNDEGKLIETLSLAEAFFKPSITQENGIETILNGLAQQFQQKIDAKVVESLRSFLFGTPPNAGFDLATLNIQRGRDHGLDDYNAYRTAFGLSPARQFNDITNDTTLQNQLKLMYNNNINDIDVWVGLLAEDHLPNASVGQTLHAILSKQFTALRDGDFYFYKNDSALSFNEQMQIDNTRLSDIIKRNTSIKNIKQQVFYGPCYAENLANGCEQDIPECNCASTEICNQGNCESVSDSEACDCSVEVKINNPGTFAVVIHSKQSGIKKYITTIEPNNSITVTSYKGNIFSAQNIDKPLDRQYYFITNCGQQIIHIDLEDSNETETNCLENSVEENEINAIYQVNVFNQITATNTILPNARVNYRAGKKIILKPGFKAVKGSYFNARVDEVCNNNYRIDEDEIKLMNKPLEALGVDVFPNPANQIVYINYQLPETSNLSISLHTATGKKIHTMNKTTQSKGKYELLYNIDSLADGIYYLKISTQKYIQTKKLIVHR